jgi:hypothetical protein
VYLIDEQHAAHTLGEIDLGFGERLAPSARPDSTADRAKARVGVFRQQQGERGLAAAGRSRIIE